MKSRIPATEAARHFSDLLNRVRYRNEEFVVERGGQPVCRIIPAGPARCTVADLVRLLRSAAKPDPGYWDVLAAVIKHQPKLPKSPWRR